jgi:hypothetical protein
MSKQPVIARLTMVWMLLLASFLGYRQFTPNQPPTGAKPAANRTVWLR